MISLDEARALLLADVHPVESETLPLAECGSRTLAADLHATHNQPPDPMSAMDGYAIMHCDSKIGRVLDVIGESPAGAPFAGSVTPGKAVRIATGGVVPPGAQRVVIQEIVERDGDRIRITDHPGASSHVRRAGWDFMIGSRLIAGGDRLTAARIGLAAAANAGALEVRRRPRIALLASGDELLEPGSPLEKGMIVNSAAYALAELVDDWGGIAIRHPILPDDSDACEAALRAAGLDADIIVPIGGASVGERDVLRPLFRKLGTETIFERIAVQPGKPCWHARFPDGRLVLGLPGNPVSAFVCAHLLLKPLLDALLGSREEGYPIFAASIWDLPEGGEREVYWRARLYVGNGGRLHVEPDFLLDSSLQATLAAANALIRRMPNAPPAAVGDMVEVLLTGPLSPKT
jgi:molybdopterin molybdotransferase